MNEASIVNKVRQAAAALEPAIAELGSVPVQLHTYFDRVESVGSSKALLLSPIDTSALPGRELGPVRVHCTHPTAPWTLICRSIAPIAADCARVDLTNVRLAHKRAESRPVLRHQHLSLVTPGGGSSSDSNIFPVVALDADSCVIDVSSPFELGQYLPRVEIVGDRSILRRCAASVFELVPWSTPEGNRRFRCTLRLSETQSVSNELLETVQDPARVRRVLEFAAMSNVLGWFETPGAPRGEARFVEAGRDALTLALYPPREPSSSRFIKLGFTLFAVDYEANVRVLQEATSHLRTAFPLNLRRGRSMRRDHHVSRGTEDLRLSFRNPVTGVSSEHPVVALSLQKITCEIASESELLWDGLPLDDAFLRSNDHRIQLGEVRIESLAPRGSFRRMELKVQDPQTQTELTKLLSSAVHPTVTLHNGQNFRDMLGIYKEAGLFAPHMRENLDPIVPQAKRVWHAMHQPGADVVQTFVHGAPESPDGAASVLRAWERGWVGQHLVNVSQQFNGAAGHVLIAMLDFLQRRPDGQHMVFFVKTDNRQMNSLLERFLATTGTSEVADRRSVGFWQRRAGQPELAEFEHGRVRRMRANQESMVARAAERVLGAHGAAAVSFMAGEFGIPDTSRRFAALGLKRQRSAYVVSATRGAPLYSVIEEITSQGVNFTWMLNASWLFPIHGALDKDRIGLRTALRHIIDRPKQSPTGDTFVNTAGDIDEQLMVDAGFEKLADIYMYALNRTGINRWFYYMSDRYGEVDARTHQRQVRRSGIRLKTGESLTSIAPKSRAG
ncbi:MAG TPA: hypothetical protein VJV78_02435 [Polyangiales bacterium]|nr:hypothetical protein [Polyangiales bacterium]